MFLPNTHHVFTQYTVEYVMKPVEYMAGENLTEERGKRRPLPNPNHVPNSGPDVHRLVYEPP